MTLTGIEIFKQLPKTNCGECGVPTCLAFAMQLAAKKAELGACPHVSAEAKSKLLEAAAPPIRQITIGKGERAVKVGGETLMYRHEKRFENPPALAILISDAMAESEIDSRLERLNLLKYERVGMVLRPEMATIRCDTGNAEKMTAKVSRVIEKSDCSLILMSTNPDMLAAGLKVCAARKPLLAGVTRENAEKVATLARENGCAVTARADNLENLMQMTGRLDKVGIKDIVIEIGARTLRQAFDDNVAIRKGALAKVQALGYPTIVFPYEISQNIMKETLIASIFIAKYAGIVVLSDFQGYNLFPLLVERMNIFTDPQKPLSTKEGIYEIGGPDENSPVMITTNFSLTYFIVSGEVENSRIPAYLLIKDTEGLSVMTAWSAGKFGADNIAPFVKKSGIENKVKHRKLIIPGYAAMESGGLEEELPGWEIQVGPREAAHITSYLKNWKP